VDLVPVGGAELRPWHQSVLSLGVERKRLRLDDDERDRIETASFVCGPSANVGTFGRPR
jgi:hypothetical protein